MQQKIYAIRDSKGDMYGQPYFTTTHGDAERTFKMAVNDKRSKIAQFPEDYDLYYMGTFDTVTGKLSGIDSPEHIVKGVNVIDQKLSETVQNLN